MIKNAFIQSPAANLDQSITYYQTLGFTYFEFRNYHFVTDGGVLIALNPNKFARLGIVIGKKSWVREIQNLRKLTTVKETQEGYVLNDYTGSKIYLINEAFQIDFDFQNTKTSVLGNYAGISLEVIDISGLLKLYETIGFSKISGDAEKGWVTAENNAGLSISIMGINACPHLFYNPSLTFFNRGNNPEVIDNIRQLNVPITEEITYFNKEGIVDNIIIRDPGGLGMFIFND